MSGESADRLTADDLNEASWILSRLLERSDLPSHPESGLILADIERDIADFDENVQLHAMANLDLPALASDKGPPIPVSLRQLRLPPEWEHRLAAQLRELDDNLIRIRLLAAFEALKSTLPSGSVVRIPRDPAREVFFARAVGFLAARLAWLRREGGAHSEGEGLARPTHAMRLLQRIGGAHVTTSGCTVHVTTNTPGLRVFWSGAYYISGNFFAHPTTPASSILQAGTYVFGVDGGAYGSSIQWDTSAVLTLPGTPLVHLNY